MMVPPTAIIKQTVPYALAWLNGWTLRFCYTGRALIQIRVALGHPHRVAVGSNHPLRFAGGPPCEDDLGVDRGAEHDVGWSH
jgi:hypothetical protein